MTGIANKVASRVLAPPCLQKGVNRRMRCSLHVGGKAV